MKAIFTKSLKLASAAAVATVLSMGAMTGFAKPAEAATSFSFNLGIGDGYRYYNPHRRSYYHYYYTDRYCRDYRRGYRGRSYNHYCHRGAWNAHKDYRWRHRRDWDNDRWSRRDRRDRWDRDRDGRADRFENDRGRVSDATRPRNDRDRDGRIDRYEDDRGRNSDTRRRH